MRPAAIGMNTIIKTAFACILLCVGFETHAQHAFTGTLEEWEPGVEAQVIAGMRDPFEIGKLTAEGSFSIPLDMDFLKKMQEEMEQANKADSRWTASLMSLESAFSCLNGQLQMSGASQPLVKLSSFGGFGLANIPERKMYGAFMAVDSEVFAEAFLAVSEYRSRPGYYLDWYFFEEAANVQGECIITSYAVNQEESFEKTSRFSLDFNPGWNLVRYEVESVFTDKEGKTYPKVIHWETLEELPGDVKFLYMTN